MSSDANPNKQKIFKSKYQTIEKIQDYCLKNMTNRNEDRRKKYRINSGRRQIDLLTYY